MAQEWNIRSRGDTCTKTGEVFADGATVVSRLVFGEDGYRREDYHDAEWTDDLKDEAVSVWRSVYHPPPPPPEEPVKKETAESLLRQLMETEAPENANVIYILAVMLERRRILVERDVHLRDDGGKMRFYEHRKSGETFLVPDPELKLSELEDVQREVLERLGGA
jgi:hypothetical protein